jgi:two-component system, cell cycle sensor histidine kinase and response regulator CckA
MDGSSQRWGHWVLGIAFLLLGGTSLLLLEADHRRIQDNLHAAVSASDKLSRIRLHLAHALLDAERAQGSDPSVDRALTVSHLDEALQLLDDWLQGRSSLVGIEGVPPSDPELLVIAEDYRNLLQGFRSDLAATPAPGSVGLRVRFGQTDRAGLTLERRLREQLQAQARADQSSHRRRRAMWATLILLGTVGVLAYGRGRRWAMRRRMAAESRYRQIVENAPVGIAQTNRNGTIHTANQAFAELLGYASGEELVTQSPQLLDEVYVDPGDRRRILSELASSGVVRNEEVRWRRRDGEALWVRIAGVVQRAEDGSPGDFLAFVRDITRERSLEDQLIQSQKMEALGTLAGGMAHDFNNLLTPILVNADLVKLELGESHPAVPDLEEIRSVTQRAAELTRRILIFSRKEEFELQVLDLNQVVRGMEGLLRRTLPADVVIDFQLADEPCWVESDSHQLEHAVMNLAVNARDAMPDGGMLVLETSSVELDESYAEDHLEGRPGPYVTLEVTDTGTGMDPATQRRIFDPFFTTKGPTEGTGLGLSTVYGVVKRSDGHIRVYSEPGHGTTFRIFLPRARPGDPRESKSFGDGKATSAPALDRVSVLVVDDDHGVRRAAVRALENAGHLVHEASNGQDALSLLQDNGSRVDLLLTDVIMPGMDGAKLSEQARTLRPDLRVLVMSGYSNRSVQGRGSWVSRARYIRKPFTANQIVTTVRGMFEPSP